MNKQRYVLLEEEQQCPKIVMPKGKG
jgi:hypothetical protein